MRTPPLFPMMTVFLLFSPLREGLCGAIMLDEDFDGPEIFVDRAWPVVDSITTLTQTDPPTSTSISVKGLNLRLWDTTETLWRRSAVAWQGTIMPSSPPWVVDFQWWWPGKCLRLRSGDYVRTTSVAFPTRSPLSPPPGWGYRVWQFAVSGDHDYLRSYPPGGTRMGHFTVWFSTDGDDQADTSVSVQLFTSTAYPHDDVDYKLSMNGWTTNILTRVLWGESPRRITLVAATSLTSDGLGSVDLPWVADDTVNPHNILEWRYKGPNPSRMPPEAIGDFYKHTAGIHVYTREDSPPAVSIASDQIGHGWGDRGTTATTREIGWEIAAENGATLYIDDLYWDCGDHQAFPQWYFTTEQAARMHDFNPPLFVIFGESTAAARAWSLYE